jgi:protein gp37
MGDKTSIEWTDATWNPVRGCAHVSEGCKNCYAERVAARFSKDGQPYAGTITDGRWSGTLTLWQHLIDLPLRWKRPRRIFVNSMSDMFHENLSDQDIDQVFRLMEKAKHHTFQVLTKRPRRMLEWFGGKSGAGLSALALPNVWLGVSVENQRTAYERIPLLLRVPAAVRFLSCEPLLGPVDLERPLPVSSRSDAAGRGIEWIEEAAPLWKGGIDWVIAGGESGPGARPMHPEWARGLRDQCQAAGVPFFFKQWGEWEPISQMPKGKSDTLYHEAPKRDPEAIKKSKVESVVLQLDGRQEFAFPAGAMTMLRVGKRSSGRLLDGRTWDEFPQ